MSEAEKPRETGGKEAGKKARPKLRTRGAKISEELWAALREMYESGNYTQRDLVNFVKAKGLRISQATIGRRAINEGWVRGSRIKELREELRREILQNVGDSVTKMLEGHMAHARMVQAEALMHFKRAAKNREVDPNYTMAPAALSTLTGVLRSAHEMESRAIGFDYDKGRPYQSAEKDADNQPKVMQIQVMSEEEERAVQEEAERQLREGEDPA